MRSRYLRIHDQTRTGTLELLDSFVPATYIYRTASYDFDERLARSKGALRAGRFRTVLEIVRQRPEVVEMNEPAMIRAWPSTLMYVTVILLLNILRLSKTKVVTYAIENGDVVRAFASYSRLPLWISDWAVRYGMSYLSLPVTKIAFGSQGARNAYERLVPKLKSDSIASRNFVELAMRCPMCDIHKKRRQVLFLGSFEHRKGVIELLEAWKTVEPYDLTAKLVLAGKGALVDEVMRRSSEFKNVLVEIDPERTRIHSLLSESKVLVLYSQHQPRWREQIGRPILEGLSHGCEIVSSSDTGIAEWLEQHDHKVLKDGTSTTLLAEAIRGGLNSSRQVEAITGPLPLENARTSADSWLFLDTDPDHW